MKTFTISNPWSKETTEVFVTKSKYANGRTCLHLIDASDGIPYAIATVNVPDAFLEPNHILIKDYSENTGVYDFLVENNIVKPTEYGIQQGFVWLPMAELLPEDQWGQLDPPPAEIDPATGKSVWEINGYRIWADTYQDALNHLSMIESF